MNSKFRLCLLAAALLTGLTVPNSEAADPPAKAPGALGTEPEKNMRLIFNDAKKPEPDPRLAKYGMYEESAPRPEKVAAVDTGLPLKLNPGDRIALIGNTLLDRGRDFGFLEALLQKGFPEHEVIVRNLAWAGDSIDSQPRPLNLADLEQHLTYEKIDVVIAAFGFNESFAGKQGLPEFRKTLEEYLKKLKTSGFNGETAPRIILLSPIANEDIDRVAAGTMNNDQLAAYAEAMKQVAAAQKVGFVDVFTATKAAMDSPGDDLTMNGIHLKEEGYQLLAGSIYRQLFDTAAPSLDEALRAEIQAKDEQYFYRYRPLNTYYYTGGRSEEHGYYDFLPAMRNFDLIVDKHYQRIWKLARGESVAAKLDLSDLPELEPVWEARGTNPWLTPEKEKEAFILDPRFEVNLFASEVEFPEIACPISIRWDSRGRLWVSCSTSYPQIMPGQTANDKLVILEDTDGDGKADKSSIFAEGLYTPLSFEFGDGGVYVSQEPHLLFIKDTDGDGKADYRQKVLTGFGCEDSHHALHDFVWSPDGDLMFRESIFHHSQIETPYGPVRQQNSGWFRYDRKTERLTSFGTYSSTNPWGVTFDDWGQHVASHPIFASAFHALDPAYPEQHPKPVGLPAYSGTCGHDFVDFKTFPEEMQGGFVKARYKPTNRIEFHQWVEGEFGYEEKYVNDILFSKDLSFIPVDLRFGPRGDLYVCDWYNPIKSHNQYSMRDPRRDRESGRIWRITAKDSTPVDPPEIANADIPALLDNLKLPHYRYRYWTRRELRDRNHDEVGKALDTWVAALDPADARYRHHQVEALWMYRGIGETNTDLLVDLLNCNSHHARAAATRQLRYWHSHLDNADALLAGAADDSESLVRMEAAIAASYIGTEGALTAMLNTLKHPYDGHLSYAIRTSLGSHTLKPLWADGRGEYLAAHPELGTFLADFDRSQKLRPVKAATPEDKKFDAQENLARIDVSIVKERLLFSLNRFEVQAGQPVRLELLNPDATPHNLVIVEPGALEEIGLAATQMATDPEAAKSGQVLPDSEKILEHSRMLNANQAEVMRFNAPQAPGVYPYLCTFPGHWVLMRGEMVVK